MKSVALKGVIWSAADKFAIEFGHFAIGIVLARLLMPKDFGLIGMLTIFIAISQSFIDSGMGSGLIQKRDRTDTDFSTVFVFNLVVSVVFYLILYITAPLIARFYNMPQLVVLSRVLSVNILINALAIVQSSKLTISLDFKTIAKVNVSSVFFGGLIAISFAMLGFGVWALVVQNISRAGVSVILFWYFSKWKPSLLFSTESFRNLFGFGSNLLISGLLAQTMNNVYNIIIGKAYSPTELGYYTKARGFAEMTAGTVSGILHKVTYPILTSIQEDKARLISVYSRLIKMTAFIVFPTMTLLALLADPFIRILLTDKWVPAIILLKWMCFARIFYPVSVINMNILNVIGRSDLFLKVDLFKIPIIIGTLIISIPLGVKAMVIGHVVSSGISFFINAYLPGKLFGYGAIHQLKDMLPIVIATLIMGVFVALTVILLNDLILKLLIGSLIAIVTYLLTCYLFKINELNEIKQLLLKI